MDETGEEEARGEAPAEAQERPPWRLWDHIGIISGVLLGLVAFAFLVLLAVAGDPSALAIVVVIVIGIVLIYVGGQLHGARRRGAR